MCAAPASPALMVQPFVVRETTGGYAAYDAANTQLGYISFSSLECVKGFKNSSKVKGIGVALLERAIGVRGKGIRVPEATGSHAFYMSQGFIPVKDQIDIAIPKNDELGEIYNKLQALEVLSEDEQEMFQKAKTKTAKRMGIPEDRVTVEDVCRMNKWKIVCQAVQDYLDMKTNTIEIGNIFYNRSISMHFSPELRESFMMRRSAGNKEAEQKKMAEKIK